MNITFRRKARRVLSESSEANVNTPISRIGIAACLVLANASVALGQSIEESPSGDPLEETWRYLVELFRMILNI